MRIVAYTYDSDVHCVDCARKAQLKCCACDGEDKLDEHGIPVYAEDSEGNPVHPVFSTDEQLEPQVCGDCGEEIE